MERHDTIDAIGQLSTRQYVPPDDYSTTEDERPTTEQLRLETFKRLRAIEREVEAIPTPQIRRQRKTRTAKSPSTAGHRKAATKPDLKVVQSR